MTAKPAISPPPSRRSPANGASVTPLVEEGATLRIGEVAKLVGVTTRTLRYWEEVGLFSPSSHRESGERLYSSAEVERVSRIRELQVHLGFSLAEVRAVLEVEDLVDKLRTASREDPLSASRRKLLHEAIDANDRLLTRLDDTLARVRAFRDERAGKAERMRAISAELDAEVTTSS